MDSLGCDCGVPMRWVVVAPVVNTGVVCIGIDVVDGLLVVVVAVVGTLFDVVALGVGVCVVVVGVAVVGVAVVVVVVVVVGVVVAAAVVDSTPL